MRLRSILPSLAVILFAGCSGDHQNTSPRLAQPAGPTPSVSTGPVGGGRSAPGTGAGAKVGLLVPLTGSSAKVGKDLLDAAQMALFDVQATELELIPRDTGGTGDGAVRAANSALDEGAKLLVGPLFGAATTAVAPLATSRSVPVLSFSNDAAAAAPNVWVMGFRPEEQVGRVVSYAAGQGLTRFGALAPDDAYGTRALNAYRAALASVPGSTDVRVQTYAPGTESAVAATDQLTGLPDPTNPEAVPTPPPDINTLLVADGGQTLRAMIRRLGDAGMAQPKVRLLGTLRWQEDPGLLREPAADGAWLATWPPEAIDSFQRRFESVYGRQPVPLAVLAYDAVALAAAVADSNGGFRAQELTDAQGFMGQAGIFRLLPSGLVEHGLAVVQVQGGSVGTIEPAPASFPAGIASR